MIKVTPQTFIDMNKEFEEEGTPFILTIPTQQMIDDQEERSRHCFPKVVHHAPESLK